MNADKGTIYLDDLPIGKFHCKLIALTFGAHFTDGYIIGLIGIVLTVLAPIMDLTPFWEGVIGASVLLGLFFGSFIAGVISDHTGRQKIFLYSFIIIALGSVMQFFVTTPLELAICRVFIGIGIGGDYSVGHALLAEFCPRKNRGAILGSFSVVWTVGYVLAACISTALIRSDLANDMEVWRWILASSVIPAVFILIGRMNSPESARWLINKGRIKEAQAIIKKHFGENVVLHDEDFDHTHAGFRALFKRKYIKRTIFNSVFFICIVMPYFAIYTFLPLILEIIGVEKNFTASLALDFALIIGAFIGIWCTMKFSRRGFLIGSFMLLTVILTTLALLPSNQLLLLLLLFSIFTLSLSAVGNLVGVFPAESFPTEVRSSGIGFVTAMSRLGSALSTFLFPVFLDVYGFSPTMLMLSGVLFLGLVVSYAWAPETKGLPLAKASKVEMAPAPEAVLASQSAGG